jgi:hypothetical protein
MFLANALIRFLFDEPSPIMAISGEVQREVQYRIPKQLSFALARQTEIFFEEKLCMFNLTPRRV